jgi:hypothetical protein
MVEWEYLLHPYASLPRELRADAVLQLPLTLVPLLVAIVLSRMSAQGAPLDREARSNPMGRYKRDNALLLLALYSYGAGLAYTLVAQAADWTVVVQVAAWCAMLIAAGVHGLLRTKLQLGYAWGRAANAGALLALAAHLTVVILPGSPLLD